MSLADQSITTQIEDLNNFLQASLNYRKDNSLPDIKLNRLEFDNVRIQLDDSLKDYIIEFVYVNQEGHLIKKSSNEENINVIQNSPLSPNIVNLQPLVIIRSNSDASQVAHLYRCKKLENNQIILEYLGKKALPTLLLTTQSLSDLSNDEQYEEDLTNNNVNIVHGPKPIMTLSFAENGTCYLVIDTKKKTIVATDNSDTQHFKNFVANNCPRNGSLNIEVDESGKVICAYTINNETVKKEYIKIAQDLIDKIEKVIAAAYSLQTNISVPTPKPPVPNNNSFPAKEVNASASPATTLPLNSNANQNNSTPTV